MNWNHRVWRVKDKYDGELFVVKETYYNSAGEICACTENAAGVSGYTYAELKENLNRMVWIVSITEEKDVLDEGFVFAKWDGDDDEEAE